MPFYPDDAPVPTEMRTDEFLLRPLRATDVELDYEAVMASQETLRRGSGGLWPRPDFTLEENLADLQGHEADFGARRRFTYTVMDATETRCLGCVYAYPAEDEAGSGARDGEAMVWFWVRPDGVAADLDRLLLAALVPWLRDDFAFTRVLYRARAGDARQADIFGEAGLRFVETRTARGVEDLISREAVGPSRPAHADKAISRDSVRRQRDQVSAVAPQDQRARRRGAPRTGQPGLTARGSGNRREGYAGPKQDGGAAASAPKPAAGWSGTALAWAQGASPTRASRDG